MKKEDKQLEARAVLLKMRDLKSLSYFSRVIKYDRSTLSKMALGKRPISKKVLTALLSPQQGQQTLVTGLERQGFSALDAFRLAKLKPKDLHRFHTLIEQQNKKIAKQAAYFHTSLRKQKLIAKKVSEKTGKPITEPKAYWRKKRISLDGYVVPPIDRDAIFKQLHESMMTNKITKEEEAAAKKAIMVIAPRRIRRKKK